MLGDAVSVFAGMAVLAEIGLGRNGAADIDQSEPKRPPDCRVGAPARAEHAVAVVQSDVLDNRTVDDDQRSAGMGRGLAMGEPVLFFEHGFDRGDDDRKIGRYATRHHRIGGDGAQSREPHGRRNEPDDGVGRAPAHAGQHVLDPLRRWRNDRQAVGPAALVEVIVDRLDGVGKLRDVERRLFGSVEHDLSSGGVTPCS